MQINIGGLMSGGLMSGGRMSGGRMSGGRLSGGLMSGGLMSAHLALPVPVVGHKFSQTIKIWQSLNADIVDLAMDLYSYFSEAVSALHAHSCDPLVVYSAGI